MTLESERQLPTSLTGDALESNCTSATELVHFVTAGTAILTWVAGAFVDIFNNTNAKENISSKYVIN